MGISHTKGRRTLAIIIIIKLNCSMEGEEYKDLFFKSSQLILKKLHIN